MLTGGASGIKLRSTPGNHLITLSKAMYIPEDQRDAQDLDMESEIRAIDSMKHGIKELLYLKKVLDSLSLSEYVSEMLVGFDSKFPVIIYEDDRVTIQMTARPMSHSSVKYLEADVAWIHDHIADGSIILVHVNSSFNLANIGTKYLNPTEFRREVIMCMSDGVYESLPSSNMENLPGDIKLAVLSKKNILKVCIVCNPLSGIIGASC